MYASLKSWINVPITIKPFLKRSATGDKLFGESRIALCYPKGEVSVVRNWQGVEVESHNQLFIDGSVEVTELDNIIFENKEVPVQTISNFYRDGVIDIRVVYI